MTTATDAAELGLRERKRRATRRAIQLAALHLVAERGLDNVTIDEVSRVADISPRTFFNYFPSKEEAILGDPPILAESDSVERFVVDADGTTVFDGLVTVLIEVGDTSLEDAEMMQLRHTLVKEYPQLFALRMAKMRDFEEQIAGVIARRLRHDLPGAEASWIDRRARLMTHVSLGVIRHAWASWATAEPRTALGVELRRSFDEVRTLFS
ncbi:MAG: TetR family transcriptional regulator [Rhodoglobus sp.]